LHAGYKNINTDDESVLPALFHTLVTPLVIEMVLSSTVSITHQYGDQVANAITWRNAKYCRRMTGDAVVEWIFCWKRSEAHVTSTHGDVRRHSTLRVMTASCHIRPCIVVQVISSSSHIMTVASRG